ncbi:type IX secretion system protein PorQ [Polaribacter gochangensis]|uniref:type IX secretion system protein PorQ n=1 Tax=Polaribacter gochangensis TaxID=3252903 RepID=UPI00390489D3
MKIAKSLFITFIFPSLMFSQVGGESVYQFLNISTSAKQTALGGKVLTLINDVNQPLWNPSVINENLDNQLAVNYSSYLSGINIGSVSFAKRINRRFGTLQGNVKYINYGSIIEADESGNITGNFSASDIALSIGYAVNLPWTNLYAGANIKLINSSISAYSSIGIAADIGFLYHNPHKPFVITLVVRNIGTQISSFNDELEKLPLEVLLGGSYQLENVPVKWYLTIDNLQQWNVSVSNPSNQVSDIEGNITEENVTFVNNALRHFIVGVELFSESAINLRMGYNFRKSQEYRLQNIRTFGGISLGFGLKMNNFKLNYAYSKVHTATNISTFSLQIDLDRKR